MEENIQNENSGLSDLAKSLSGLGEEHMGWVADGHHSDADMLAAADQMDEFMLGEDKAETIGTYTVRRGYGQWAPCPDDGEDILVWNDEPHGHLKPMTRADHRDRYQAAKEAR